MEDIICDKCHTHFSLEHHEQGLVVDDSIFICEECHHKHIEEESNEIVSDSTQITKNGMPIALWLIQQQNKGKQFMSMKK